jgi:hypothetical protein
LIISSLRPFDLLGSEPGFKGPLSFLLFTTFEELVLNMFEPPALTPDIPLGRGGEFI